MEIFTKNEMNLMFDSFNGIGIHPQISLRKQLFGVLDDEHLFPKWEVDAKILEEKLNYTDEDGAKLIVREILNFWGDYDRDQLLEINLTKALADENYEFAAKIRDNKVTDDELRQSISLFNKSRGLNFY